MMNWIDGLPLEYGFIFAGIVMFILGSVIIIVLEKIQKWAGLEEEMPNIEVWAKSKCCESEVKIIGRTTRYYECQKCKKPCDVKFFNIDKGVICK